MQRSAKGLSSHKELSTEQKEYIAWHNARREARRVRSSSCIRALFEPDIACLQKKPSTEADAERAEEPDVEPDTGGEKTHFHGKSEFDYAGNSWIVPPKDKKKQGDENFLPKRWVHTWCAEPATHVRTCAQD